MTHYSNIGYVNFPIHDRDPESGRLLWPNQRTGFATVRMVVEDLTADARYDPAEGFAPYAEDFMVGAEGFKDGHAAFKYFGEPGHRYVQNVLLGSVNWAGARGGTDYWVASKADLTTECRQVWENLEATAWAGCKLHVVTSLNQRASTVQSLMEEAESLQLPVRDVEWQPARFCRACKAEKPQRAAKRLGWRRAPQGHFWECPTCRTQPCG